MATDQQMVLDMFERPYEHTTFETTPDESEGRPILFDVATRTGGAPPPAQWLPRARAIPTGSVFSVFNKSHRLAAKELCDFLMEASDVTELSTRVKEVQKHLNEKLFIYALSFVILRNEGMRNVRLPSIVEVFPTTFVPRAILAEMQGLARTPQPGQNEIIREYGPEFSSTHLKPEHRVAYWREDYGINSHHWHWHLVYPLDMGVVRDRKGELFYYMHQQMLARYDMDRLSVGLNRVEKLSNWRVPIRDGYFSKLTINNSGQAWGTRQDNTMMQDFRREDFGLGPSDISDMEQMHSRIMDAIHQGFLVDREGNKVTLSDEVTPPTKRGIDLLGDAIEADSGLSVNSPFYGDLHNLGHVMISSAHDPDNAHRENLGVMSDPGTAMRDPVFYRWHRYTDDLFQAYKITQPPYTLKQLSLSSVRVEVVEVESDGRKNLLTTGWNTKDFQASRGLDFNATVPVTVRLTHLDHRPFRYNLKVLNDGKVPLEVTIRIFMAPKHNERGIEMNFMDQRLLWAEMDRFTYTLKPGSNSVRQESTRSSITNVNDFTFRDLLQPPNPDNPGAPENTLFNFCGCGWPQHMLLPRGKQEGMTFQLFVIVTDWKQDKVTQSTGKRLCANASSYCGILDARYPDSRPMGFPFDRRPMPMLFDQPLQTAADLTKLSNVAMQDITITFTSAQVTQ